MALRVQRLAASFCGEVAGVDLNRLDEPDIAAIKAAWLAHKVLVFHDQGRDEEGLVAFAGQLGEVEIHLDGLSEADSLELIDEYRAHATQKRFVYAHHWRVGDLVVWDNAATMHRRDPFPDQFPRLMRRVGIAFSAELRVPF